MRQVKVKLTCIQDTPPNPKNSGMMDTKHPQMKDKVMVFQRKVTWNAGNKCPGAQKRPGITWMADNDRRKAKHCRITGCDWALFGAIRGAFIPAVLMLLIASMQRWLLLHTRCHARTPDALANRACQQPHMCIALANSTLNASATANSLTTGHNVPLAPHSMFHGTFCVSGGNNHKKDSTSGHGNLQQNKRQAHGSRLFKGVNFCEL
jgi:hypothetical protein